MSTPVRGCKQWQVEEGLDSLSAAELAPLFLLMLAHLLADAPSDLYQLILPPVEMRVRQHRIPVLRIDVPQHRTAEVADVKCGKEPPPTSKPSAVVRVQHRHLVLRLRTGLWLRSRDLLPGLVVFQGNLCSMFAQPVEPTVLFICEHGRRCILSDASGGSKSTGSGADDENVEDLGINLEVVAGRRHVFDFIILYQRHLVVWLQGEVMWSGR